MTTKDTRVTTAAAAEGWVLTTARLRELGCGADWIRRRACQGWLTPLHRGVYLVGRRAPGQQEVHRAALLACGPRSALTGWSAAAQYGLVQRHPDHGVTVASPTHRRADWGIDCLRRDLDPHEVTMRHGLRTVTVAAMLGELTKYRDEDELARVIHEAEVRKLLNRFAVERWIEEHPGRQGIATLKAAFARYRPLTGSVRSLLEGRLHAFCSWAELPPSEHNVLFEADGGLRSVDVLFRKQWLAVEIDGGPHQSARNFYEDRERDRCFEADHGLPVMRVTDRDLSEAGRTALARQLWAVLARRDPTLRVPPRFGHVAGGYPL